MDYCAEMMLNWDVANGVARRSWSGNQNGQETILRTMKKIKNLQVTVPSQVSDNIVTDLFSK